MFRVLDRGRRHLFEAHRAPAFEHGQRRVQRAWHDRRIESCTIEVLLARQIPIDIHRLRGPTLTDDRSDLVLLARIDQHQAFTAEAVQVLLEHAAGKHRRHSGIERIAALQQNPEPCGGRQGMPRRDPARRPHHGGTEGGSGRLAIRLQRHLASADCAAHQDNGRTGGGPHEHARALHHGVPPASGMVFERCRLTGARGRSGMRPAWHFRLRGLRDPGRSRVPVPPGCGSGGAPLLDTRRGRSGRRRSSRAHRSVVLR